MKLATAAYPLDILNTWADYESKLTDWVTQAADAGADLMVFPEYGAMELASLDGPADDMETALRSVDRYLPRADDLHDRLARQHQVTILAASAPAFDNNPRPVNRARLFGPDGPIGQQDKQIMTMVERDIAVVPGAPLQVFDTTLGRVGVLICYDGEFPDLGRALVDAGVLIILAPSFTKAVSGYWRVRIGAMARALEGQCITVHSPCVGDGLGCPAFGPSTGAAGAFGPPDLGFPDDGIIALGDMNAPGWVFADIADDAVTNVRNNGAVRNFQHRNEQSERLAPVKFTAAE